MAYPPQQQQPLTRQQRFDEQDKADQEFANQQQALRIQQQRADADEENQAIQQQRFQFERQRWPLDLYSAQAQAEAQRANAQFQQQQMAEQLRTAPQRERQGEATLAATEQGTKDAIASAARAEELSQHNILQRAVIAAAEQQKQAYAKAEAERNATMFNNAQTALPTVTAQNKATLAATEQATANAKAEAERQVAAGQHAAMLRPILITTAQQQAKDLVANADQNTNMASDAQLKSLVTLGLIDAVLYGEALQLPAEKRMAYVTNVLKAQRAPGAGAGATDTQKVAADVAKAEAAAKADFIAQSHGVFNQSRFADFMAQRTKDQIYNTEEEYLKANEDKRNLIIGAHSRLSRYFNENYEGAHHEP